MSLYTWRMDRKFHRKFVKGETRNILPHLPPHKVKYVKVDEPISSPYLWERQRYHTNRCVCHLMVVLPDDELIAWPYRTFRGRVGVSWYHPEAYDGTSRTE